MGFSKYGLIKIYGLTNRELKRGWTQTIDCFNSELAFIQIGGLGMDLVMLSYKKAIKGFGPIFEDADRCQ